MMDRFGGWAPGNMTQECIVSTFRNGLETQKMEIEIYMELTVVHVCIYLVRT